MEEVYGPVLKVLFSVGCSVLLLYVFSFVGVIWFKPEGFSHVFLVFLGADTLARAVSIFLKSEKS